jgi:hypothetical protein
MSDPQPNALQGSSIPFAPTHRKKSRTGLIVAIALGLVMLACGAVTMGSLLAGGGSEPIAKMPITEAPAAKQKVAPAKTIKALPADIQAGTWRVGSDVKPGRYVTKGASNKSNPLCYWDVRTGSEDGPIKTQGVKDTMTAQGVVTLVKGQYFTTIGCQPWKAKA